MRRLNTISRIAVAWAMQKYILILLFPVYLLCTGCPPEEGPVSCEILNQYVNGEIADKYEVLYKRFVGDTVGTAWRDTIFQVSYPDSSAEKRRLLLKRCTDSCTEVATEATNRLCDLSNQFEAHEKRRIESTPLPWRIFTRKKTNPYEDESYRLINDLNRVTDSVFVVVMDSTAIF